MSPRFKVQGRIAKPIAAVYEAVADPAVLSKYFTTGGAKGRLEAGATVTWDFADFPGPFPVEVKSARPNESIELEWGSSEGDNRTKVEFRFESLGSDRTLVTIEEEGWRDTEAGFKAAFNNCEGWTQMLCCMKAWLEHGIVLREGMYK